MGDALLAPRSLGALTGEMARLLTPAFGRDAEHEARELLAALHDMPRHWPLLERGTAMSADAWERALAAAARRARGAPLQYAAGRAAFRHLTLDVDERVLIPRPETEQLVEIVLELTRDSAGGVAVDVGTGSGAIALALASEGTFEQVIATDVSLDALDVARGNVRRCAAALRAAVSLRHGSLLGPVLERGMRAVVSNPPYIAYDEAASLPAGVRNWEPAVALYSGADGMAATARLVREAALTLATDGLLAVEVDARRAGTAAELVASAGAYADVRVLLDLTGRERFVVARRREERE
ncbi:MAG TPA: peptide chain release factor N(5)-glutamine methyltransferase [Gemmatimonadaceae bacterium]